MLHEFARLEQPTVLCLHIGINKEIFSRNVNSEQWKEGKKKEGKSVSTRRRAGFSSISSVTYRQA